MSDDIIIERDKKKIITFKIDNSNQDEFIILWEKEFDEFDYFRVEKDILNMVSEDDIKIIDIYTGKILHEYYNLWPSKW